MHIAGARVAIQCGGGDTPLTVRESNTNWFGGFSIRMEGSPDMNRCTARVVQGTGHCGAATAGAPRELTLAFRMLGLALYTVPPLLSQPEEAMDFCPGRDRRTRPPPPPPAAARWPWPAAAAPAPAPPLPPFWRRRRLPPIWRKPPTSLPQQQDQPQVPPPPQVLPPPPAPALQGSACTYEYVDSPYIYVYIGSDVLCTKKKPIYMQAISSIRQWASPEHRCHWKVVTPNTTVAMAFGPLAAQRYGSELTLRDALEGRGDMYRTLLREATAALLNAYYNAPGGPFLYPTTASVIDHMNGALLSSTQRVLIEGARFRRANAGGGGPAGRTRLPCVLTPCCCAAPPPAPRS